ncbi:mucin-binding protein [Lacticaseibacillus nasuensis]|uniref:mucin-binding protein n=1 Tax=Lacticaseibacillus nasuensis TaxID=944671 RepID=UPI0015845A04
MQTAPSTRTATVDAITGKRLSYSDWTNGDFAAVKAPKIPGYTPDVAEVPEAKKMSTPMLKRRSPTHQIHSPRRCSLSMTMQLSSQLAIPSMSPA